MKKKLPNQTAILVLGIISICSCLVVGLVCGIISLVMAKKSLQEYEANPSLYDETSLNTLKAGKTCAIIGTSISGAVTLFFILYMIMVGTYFTMLFSVLGNS